MSDYYFVTFKFPETATPLVNRLWEDALRQRIADVPTAYSWEQLSPDLHIVGVGEEFRTTVNDVLRRIPGGNLMFQRLDAYRAADIVHRFLRGYKKKSSRRSDAAFRAKYGLRNGARNEIRNRTWQGITDESKAHINSLIKMYR